MTEVSIVPQYAMSALNPTRKIGKMITDLLKSHRVRDRDAVMTELKRRLELVGPQRGRARASTRSSSPAA